VKTLITGGAGYIGSTIVSACADQGIEVVVLDDLSTGCAEYVLRRPRGYRPDDTAAAPAGQHPLYVGDIADGVLLDTVFADHPDIESVIHCAGKIVVPDSVADPIRYYQNNVCKTLELVQNLLRHGCRRMVFSSSASVYRPDGEPSVDENSALEPQSPYARTKFMAELILRDVVEATELRVIALRYFNPIGADPQLRTGNQSATPQHALGKLLSAHESGERFTINGTDLPTRDGTPVRDYVHVWDLALAHVAAIERFDSVLPQPGGYEVINLGSGQGTTVRELVDAFRAVTGGSLLVAEAGRRPGDTVGCYTHSDKAFRVLGWTPTRTLEDGLRDALAWSARRAEVVLPAQSEVDAVLSNAEPSESEPIRLDVSPLTVGSPSIRLP
jgi:UDP-glucose 4-epimerase